MAIQAGIIPLIGSIGNLTFSKNSNGFLAFAKSGPTADQIATDPRFARTRENMVEFKTAAHAATLITTAFSLLNSTAKDNRMYQRLFQSSMKAIKGDITSARGLRNMTDGKPELMKGFQFNANSKMASTLITPYTLTNNTIAGSLDVDIPSFRPANCLRRPETATHYAIVTGAATIDFGTSTFTVNTDSSAILPIGILPSLALSLSCPIIPGPGSVYQVLGVQFYQQVNGNYYPLSNHQFNPLTIVSIDL